MTNGCKNKLRVKAANPKGFRDYVGVEVLERQSMLKKIAEIYYSYGFEALETPAVENIDALGKFLPDVEQPNAGVFSWLDEENKWLALRYDLTAPLARFYSQFRSQLPLPYRRFSLGPVWRNEKPGPGRFRQFYQCDADSVGVPNVMADAELCLMLSDILENLGLLKVDYKVRINNRKILDGILEKIGMSYHKNDTQYDVERGLVLRALDKLDRLGLMGVTDLLGAGRRDDSGDFSSGAQLTETQIQVIVSFISSISSRNDKTLKNLADLVSGSEVGMAGVSELETMFSFISSVKGKDENFIIDPTIVRGLGYYTGPVFEAELTKEILDSKGQKRQFGSVAGGGRYDDLIKRFTGEMVPSTGVSIGVDRLLSALSEMNKGGNRIDSGPVLVTVMDKGLINYYQGIVAELRENKIRAEMFMGNPKDFGKQLKYADKRNSPAAVIVGSEESERGVVQVKDLKLGLELSKTITSNVEWKSRPAQHEILRSELVSVIQKLIDRSGEFKQSG